MLECTFFSLYFNRSKILNSTVPHTVTYSLLKGRDVRAWCISGVLENDGALLLCTASWFRRALYTFSRRIVAWPSQEPITIHGLYSRV
jgi:hypothetical protein